MLIIKFEPCVTPRPKGNLVHTYQYDVYSVPGEKLSSWRGSFHSMSISWCSTPGWSLFVCVPFFLPLFVSRRVVSQPSTSRTWYTRYYTDTRYYTAVQCCTAYYIYDMHLYIQRCWRCWCCSACSYTAVVAAAADAVRHRVPHGKNCCWLIESDSIQCFLSWKTIIFIVPLGCSVAFTASICLYYILGNYGHAWSQGGRQPAALKPPL